MLEIILSAVITTIITTFSIVIGYYVLTKKANEMIETNKKTLKNDMEIWLNSETGQKALYSIGALIGNGAKSGIGIQTKSGKFKWQDLIGQIVGSYVQGNILPKIAQTNPLINTSKKSTESFKIE